MQLQQVFVKNIRLYFKEKGEAWLENLPNLIRYCEQKWSMRMGEPYSLSVNYVAPAVMEDGKDVVVKLCIPGDGFMDELDALNLFSSKGMVQLIDHDAEYGVLILEKLSPGHTLAEVVDHEEATQIAASVIQNLKTPAPDQTRLPTTKAREENLKKQIKNHPDGIGPITREALDRALKVFTYLNGTTGRQYLLHGDFHHYNVLASGDGMWTAIDPKGLIGEIEYDLIQYMLNKQPDEGAFDVIEKRVEIFSEELNLNKERLLLWGYCHTVLSTAWSVDLKDGSYSESFFQGIELFEKLYEEAYFGDLESFLTENSR